VATDAYGQNISLPSLTDAPNAQLLGGAAGLGAMVPQLVMRFASATTRAATLTSPVAGMLTWLIDVARYEYYSGAAWKPLMPPVVTMGWTALSSLGTYTGGFSAGAPAPRMRKSVDVDGTEIWDLEGRIGITSITPGVGGLVTAFTFNVGFRPTSERGFMTYATSAGAYAMFTAIKSNGQLQIAIPSPSGGATSVSLDGVRITNPAAI
jgi:hypothetical protein